ncbi:MAG: type II toxin-antitoxin system mRNA interferase toxin, RelE/StbE family [Candidatus Magnetoovum sp. WYHC-5]|nr:type II toxin-antitoxin system mRNA interferase toxin, RelE/StbE family [Candidatus Magnetoovum sp. WYHC-5]
MKWKIEYSKSFKKKTAKLIEKQPKLKEPIRELFLKLENNPYDNALKTHTLSGNLKGSYVCSLTYELRLVFEISDKSIHLIDIGTHDEVY